MSFTCFLLNFSSILKSLCIQFFIVLLLISPPPPLLCCNNYDFRSFSFSYFQVSHFLSYGRGDRLFLVSIQNKLSSNIRSSQSIFLYKHSLKLLFFHPDQIKESFILTLFYPSPSPPCSLVSFFCIMPSGERPL